ncbi:S8 family peptidase [Thalassotalea sp. M1531]|uniref:S8 family peptidase n=1 Tax=Thalassotalea algicola TaxID=2716224 RepID=A0A7Y0LE01_9GAMM|nr:S8 family peptidase [Thalassotalea algicola]NMP32412.1 S8 family peptidase [Thalassotalea algicola]
MTQKNKNIIQPLVAVIITCSYLLAGIANAEKVITSTLSTQATSSYILSNKDLPALLKLVKSMGLKPTHSLPIINSIAVNLTQNQLVKIQKTLPVKVSQNHNVKSSAWGSSKKRFQPLASVPYVIDADLVHYFYNLGEGVTIGFLDTGLDQLKGLDYDMQGRDKAWGTYDAINDTISNYDDEASGHGTHVASVAGNSDTDMYGNVYGVAPNAALVGIKAFDAEGKASYADIIRGISWALDVKDQINLRVLNMSFSAPIRSHYWDDPLNQAVMKAWQEGMVVVASAGNTGPDPMTIGVPGNVPYIITVGAMSDNYTITEGTDDRLATFSAAGPTYEGFVKPEIVAPGGHLSGLMSFDSQIVQAHPEYHDGGRYFEMSGTSQAAAVVSGVAALILTKDPSLTPDQVKCRIIAGADLALDGQGNLAYSVFQQGAGMVNAFNSLISTVKDCANQGLNIAKDLSDEEHYSGSANINEDGNFYVKGLSDAYIWDVSQPINEELGYKWHSDTYVDHFIWKTSYDINNFDWESQTEVDHFIWKTNVDHFIWKTNVDHFIWKTNVEVSTTEQISVNNWVEQQ